MNDICVAIPMYNFGDLTRKCIDLTIKNAGISIDIMVIDDGSEEPYVDDRVHIIRHDTNKGFTAACNTGFRYCIENKYKYVHAMNNDIEPYPDFIKILFEAFIKDPAIGIASSVREVIIDGDKCMEVWPQDILSGWAAYTKDDLGSTYYYCPWIPICSALISVETILYTGLLDKRMKNHCTDNDFCVRAGQLGYRTAIIPKSKVFHLHEITTKSLGLTPGKDQEILFTKIRCDYMKNLLEKFPLDNGNKVRGRLDFSIYAGT